MKTFSYTDYVIHNENNMMVTLIPSEISSTSLNGTCFFYNNGVYVRSVEKEFHLHVDHTKEEMYIVVDGIRIYAMDYYNPDVVTYISL